MRQINWYGNDGRCNPTPGTIENAECGVCGARMNVERNVLGTTGFAEAVFGRKHRYDRFTCPRREENWHKRIYHLKMDVYVAEINGAINYEEKKKSAGKEIIKLLKANAVR